MTPPASPGTKVSPTICLVRHAKAENREKFHGPDVDRPLTRRGHEQSRVIAGHLADLTGRKPSRVLSSEAVRCRQTVDPLSKACQLEVIEAAWLGEGSDPAEALHHLLRLAARLDPPSGVGGPVIACSHGDVIWGILDILVREGVELGERVDAPKAGAWILETTASNVLSGSLFLPDLAGQARR